MPRHNVALALMAKMALLYADQDDQLLFHTVGLPLGRDDLSFVQGSPDDGEAVREQTESAAQFARLVNRIPKVSRIWQPKDRLVWDEVQRALDPSQTRTADVERTVDEQEKLDQALQLLYGPDRTPGSVSEKYKAYQKHQTAYLNKKAQYNEAKVDAQFEESDEARQRAQARAQTLKKEVEAAMTRWKTQGYKAEIEHAIQVKAEIQGRSARVRRDEARKNVDFETSPHSQQSVMSHTSFLTTRYLPADLYEEDSDGWMSFTLSKSQIDALSEKARADLQELEDERLFDQRLEMSDDIAIDTITFEIARAEIVRPWLDIGVLESRDWMWTSEQEPLSDGRSPPSGTMPMYVSSMILARNIEVTFAGDTDAHEAERAASDQGALSIGPLLVGQRAADAQGQALNGLRLPPGTRSGAWIDDLLPLDTSGDGGSSSSPSSSTALKPGQQVRRISQGLQRTATVRANVKPLHRVISSGVASGSTSSGGTDASAGSSTESRPTGGYRGVVQSEKDAAPIDGATIVFDQHQGSVRKSVSSTNGRYEVHLPTGKYVVTAKHPSHQTYTTEPGFFVVSGSEMQTGNIFMTPAEGTEDGSADSPDGDSAAESDVRTVKSIQVLAFGCQFLDEAPNPDPQLDF